MSNHRSPRSSPVGILAAGGVAAAARSLSEPAAHPLALLEADAQPIPLRALVAEAAPQVSRMASRFSQLAALGAADCLRRLDRPLPADTRVYLATGLGDVAQTDALYYGVMPPQSEMPPPARFATSGNNMAAFFVAQHAGLPARNITLSLAELSLECALEVALSDLAAGATSCALLGGVDETTLPREFYTRRFHVEFDQPIGEGSGWLVLGNSQQPGAGRALASLLGARIMPAPGGVDRGAWIEQTVRVVEAFAENLGARARLCLMTGTGVTAPERLALHRALRQCWPACECLDYLCWAGRFPTAAAVGIAAIACAGTLPADARRTFAHVNRDRSGRTGVIVVETI